MDAWIQIGVAKVTASLFGAWWKGKWCNEIFMQYILVETMSGGILDCYVFCLIPCNYGLRPF